MFTTLQIALSLVSGFLVGFSLGLIGGGGSILAIPLLIYFVGFNHPHIAIGTTGLAVGVNAYLNLVPHARKHHVDLKSGLLFSAPGVAGVLLGAQLGLITPGKKLLFVFALLMVAIALYMLRRRCVDVAVEPGKSTRKLGRILLMGFAVGFASGYFGIGGGFLIVPGLIYSAGLNIVMAIGTSLVSVGTFGVLTAARYAIAGELDPLISLIFVVGGVSGGWAGAHLASRMPRRRLTQMFALIIIAVAVYMLYVNISAL